MFKKNPVLIAIALFVVALSSSALAQKSVSAPQLTPTTPVLSWNDQLVLHALHATFSAEMAYAKTLGNGNYGTVQSLRAADLIDDSLASGQKYGYRFTVAFHYTSIQVQGGFDVTATPIVRTPGALSFYMNETCNIRGAMRSGRDANAKDPIIEPCGASQLTENEKSATLSMRQIHSAEVTYQSTYGVGEFGTLTQLYNADLTLAGFAWSYIYRGYIVSNMTITPSTMSTPAHFSFTVVPTQYERSGQRSFYIDDTGVIRGADKNGAPADQNDPPISD